jgi:hypothetical protein
MERMNRYSLKGGLRENGRAGVVELILGGRNAL